MSDETELKLELTADDAAVFEESSFLHSEARRIKQRSIYFDTPDKRLSSAGISLRIREADGVRTQTIKVDGGQAAGLFARSEWEREIDGDMPVIDDATPLRALLGERARAVAPVFELAIDRRLWTLEEDSNVIELVLDRGEVIAGDRRAPVCEIELELRDGDPGVLFCLARRIDAVVPVKLGVLSKAGRGHRLLGAAATEHKAESLSLEKQVVVQAAFQRAALNCVRQFRLNEALIGPQNPAALHQARVALRRLRSATSTFRKIVHDEDTLLIREGLRWLAGELGNARNLDVLASRAALGPLQGRLEAARIDAYHNVAQQLASERCRALMLNLVEWISNGRWLSDSETEPLRTQHARGFAAKTLSRLHKKMKKAANLAELDDEARHLVRKNAKKLRYTSEFFGSLFDEKRQRRRYKRFIASLESLQDQLGALNDLATAAVILADLGLDEMREAKLILSGADKSNRLQSASEAHDELIDTKPFWT